MNWNLFLGLCLILPGVFFGLGVVGHQCYRSFHPKQTREYWLRSYERSIEEQNYLDELDARETTRYADAGLVYRMPEVGEVSIWLRAQTKGELTGLDVKFPFREGREKWI